MNKMGTGINKKVIFPVMVGVLLLGVLASAIPVYAPPQDKPEKLIINGLKAIAKQMGNSVDKFERVLTAIDGTPNSTIMDAIKSVRHEACSIVDQASDVLDERMTCATPSPPPRGG